MRLPARYRHQPGSPQPARVAPTRHFAIVPRPFTIRKPGFVALERLRRRYLHSPLFDSVRRHFPKGWRGFRRPESLGSGSPQRVDRYVDIRGPGVRGGRRNGGQAPPGEGWNLFQDILKANVTPITWQTWLRPLRSGDSSPRGVTVLAPTDFHLRWLVEKYGDLLEEAVAASYGPGVALHLEADPESLAKLPISTSTRRPTPIRRCCYRQRSTATAPRR